MPIKLKQITKRLLQHRWVSFFWERPHHLWAIKVTFSIALLLIPMVIAKHFTYGITLAMGVIAMALSETDMHPKKRLQSLTVTLLCFFLATLIVECLYAHPLWFSLWISFGFFFIIILGGIKSHYQTLTFGVLLVSIYAMIGFNAFDRDFMQPVLLTLGAAFYGLFSWLLLRMNPKRLLQEQLSLAYSKLSEYLDLKASMFPSKTELQEQKRNELAQKNVEVVQQIERCKNEILRYSYASNNHQKEAVTSLYNRLLQLMELHERATSSHERYDLLSKNTQHHELIEGFGLYMREIAKALRQYARCLLTESNYQHSIALQWTATALQNLMQTHHNKLQNNALPMLLNNLNRIEQTLYSFASEENSENILLQHYNGKPLKQTIKNLLQLKHPRFRFAIRLTISILAGYFIMNYFHIRNGEWILLTALLVNQQSYSATRQRFYHRILGTFIGVLLGALISDVLPTKTGQIALLLGSAYAFFLWVRQRYTIAVVFITIFVMSAFNIQTDGGLEMLLPRLLHTLIGALLGWLTARFLWADWQYKQLPKLLFESVNANRIYFESITKNTVDDSTYQQKRSNAHLADNALTSSWKSMHFEPKHKRISQKTAYNLTFLNHALLSYISAFAIQENTRKLTDDEKKMCQQINTILIITEKVLTQTQTIKETKLKHYQSEVERLNNLKQTSNNPNLILIHNITRISVDLLNQAAHLKMKP